MTIFEVQCTWAIVIACGVCFLLGISLGLGRVLGGYGADFVLRRARQAARRHRARMRRHQAGVR